MWLHSSYGLWLASEQAPWRWRLLLPLLLCSGLMAGLLSGITTQSTDSSLGSLCRWWGIVC